MFREKKMKVYPCFDFITFLHFLVLLFVRVFSLCWVWQSNDFTACYGFPCINYACAEGHIIRKTMAKDNRNTEDEIKGEREGIQSQASIQEHHHIYAHLFDKAAIVCT